MTDITQRAWPDGCRDTGSCERHRMCMYHNCVHTGKGSMLGKEIDAAIRALMDTPASEAPIHAVNCNISEKLSDVCSCGASEEPNPRDAEIERSASCDDATVMRLWRECGLPEYFLGNGGTNHKLAAFMDRIRSEGEVVALSPAPKNLQEIMRINNESLAEIERLNSLINTPKTDGWFESVRLEAAHQIERWGSDHDVGKGPLDWFWLIGFLAQKAAMSEISGNTEKARHHTISTAAALLNWFRKLTGENDTMRPGIDTPTGEEP